MPRKKARRENPWKFTKLEVVLVCIIFLGLFANFFVLRPPKSLQDWGRQTWIEHELNSELTRRGYQTKWESRLPRDLSVTDHKFLNGFLKFQIQQAAWQTASAQEMVYFLKINGSAGRRNGVFVFTGPEVSTDKLFIPDPADPKAKDIQVAFFARGSISQAARTFPFIQPKKFDQLVNNISWGVNSVVRCLLYGNASGSRGVRAVEKAARGSQTCCPQEGSAKTQT